MAKKNIGKCSCVPYVLVFLAGMIVGYLLTVVVKGSVLGAKTGTGFDEFGYNYNARIFTGKADGVDRSLDGAVWGDSTYANDHLVMKWSKGWNEARFHNGTWGPDAWEDNEWNGKVAGGSGEIWHYKIKWVGPCGADGTPMEDGGYCIWGQFEVIFSQGTVANEHFWEAHANPTGYGMN
jgi:hypothetical protein